MMGWMAWPLRHLSAKLLGPRQSRYLDRCNRALLALACLLERAKRQPRDIRQSVPDRAYCVAIRNDAHRCLL